MICSVAFESGFLFYILYSRWLLRVETEHLDLWVNICEFSFTQKTYLLWVSVDSINFTKPVFTYICFKMLCLQIFPTFFILYFVNLNSFFYSLLIPKIHVSAFFSVCHNDKYNLYWKHLNFVVSVNNNQMVVEFKVNRYFLSVLYSCFSIIFCSPLLV